MSVKVIVTDMDGTFLNDAQNVQPTTFYGAISGTEKARH